MDVNKLATKFRKKTVVFRSRNQLNEYHITIFVKGLKGLRSFLLKKELYFEQVAIEWLECYWENRLKFPEEIFVSSFYFVTVDVIKILSLDGVSPSFINDFAYNFIKIFQEISSQIMARIFQYNLNCFKLLVCKMFNCGVYNSQAILLEILFRFFDAYRNFQFDEIQNTQEDLISKELFPDIKNKSELTKIFINIQRSNFDEDCRNYLNVLNRIIEPCKIFSLVAESIYVSEKQLSAPMMSGHLYKFWIDFNISILEISFSFNGGGSESWLNIDISKEDLDEIIVERGNTYLNVGLYLKNIDSVSKLSMLDLDRNIKTIEFNFIPTHETIYLIKDVLPYYHSYLKSNNTVQCVAELSTPKRSKDKSAKKIITPHTIDCFNKFDTIVEEREPAEIKSKMLHFGKSCMVNSFTFDQSFSKQSMASINFQIFKDSCLNTNIQRNTTTNQNEVESNTIVKKIKTNAKRMALSDITNTISNIQPDKQTDMDARTEVLEDIPKKINNINLVKNVDTNVKTAVLTDITNKISSSIQPVQNIDANEKWPVVIINKISNIQPDKHTDLDARTAVLEDIPKKNNNFRPVKNIGTSVKTTVLTDSTNKISCMTPVKNIDANKKWPAVIINRISNNQPDKLKDMDARTAVLEDTKKKISNIPPVKNIGTNVKTAVLTDSTNKISSMKPVKNIDANEKRPVATDIKNKVSNIPPVVTKSKTKAPAKISNKVSNQLTQNNEGQIVDCSIEQTNKSVGTKRKLYTKDVFDEPTKESQDNVKRKRVKSRKWKKLINRVTPLPKDQVKNLMEYTISEAELIRENVDLINSGFNGTVPSTPSASFQANTFINSNLPFNNDKIRPVEANSSIYDIRNLNRVDMREEEFINDIIIQVRSQKQLQIEQPKRNKKVAKKTNFNIQTSTPLIRPLLKTNATDNVHVTYSYRRRAKSKHTTKLGYNSNIENIETYTDSCKMKKPPLRVQKFRKSKANIKSFYESDSSLNEELEPPNTEKENIANKQLVIVADVHRNASNDQINNINDSNLPRPTIIQKSSSIQQPNNTTVPEMLKKTPLLNEQMKLIIPRPIPIKDIKTEIISIDDDSDYENNDGNELATKKTGNNESPTEKNDCENVNDQLTHKRKFQDVETEKVKFSKKSTKNAELDKHTPNSEQVKTKKQNKVSDFNEIESFADNRDCIISDLHNLLNENSMTKSYQVNFSPERQNDQQELINYKQDIHRDRLKNLVDQFNRTLQERMKEYRTELVDSNQIIIEKQNAFELFKETKVQKLLRKEKKVDNLIEKVKEQEKELNALSINLLEAVENLTKCSQKTQTKLCKAEDELMQLKQVECNRIEHLMKSIVENGKQIRDEIWRQYVGELSRNIQQYIYNRFL